MRLLSREITVIVYAYGLAALPIGAAYAAGRASPLYRRPLGELAALWSRLALLIVLSVVMLNAVTELIRR
jgi:hypothetical protein